MNHVSWKIQYAQYHIQTNAFFCNIPLRTSSQINAHSTLNGTIFFYFPAFCGAIEAECHLVMIFFWIPFRIIKVVDYDLRCPDCLITMVWSPFSCIWLTLYVSSYGTVSLCIHTYITSVANFCPGVHICILKLQYRQYISHFETGLNRSFLIYGSSYWL